MMRVGFDAIVLAGGSSRRLGRAKTIEQVGGRPLLGRVTDALVDAQRVIVVGCADGAGRADVVVCEDPPGSGPVAALAAGVAAVQAAVVLTLAGDLPFLTAAALRVLIGAIAPADVALAVDGRGRDQYLLAAWRTDALRARLRDVDDPIGARLGDLVGASSVRRVRLDGDPPPWWDCDTDHDLARAREWAPVSPP